MSIVDNLLVLWKGVINVCIGMQSHRFVDLEDDSSSEEGEEEEEQCGCNLCNTFSNIVYFVKEWFSHGKQI